MATRKILNYWAQIANQWHAVPSNQTKWSNYSISIPNNHHSTTNSPYYRREVKLQYSELKICRQMTFDPSNKANSHDTLSNILHVPKIALFLRIACALDCIMPEELHYCMCPKIKLFARIACARDCIFPEYCMSPNIALCPRIALCTKIAYARTNLN